MRPGQMNKILKRLQTKWHSVMCLRLLQMLIKLNNKRRLILNERSNISNWEKKNKLKKQNSKKRNSRNSKLKKPQYFRNKNNLSSLKIRTNQLQIINKQPLHQLSLMPATRKSQWLLFQHLQPINNNYNRSSSHVKQLKVQISNLWRELIAMVKEKRRRKIRTRIRKIRISELWEMCVGGVVYSPLSFYP